MLFIRFRRNIRHGLMFALTQTAMFGLGHLASAQTTWKPNKAQIEIRIGYTLGTHKLLASTVGGSLVQADDSLTSISGRLSVPIREIKEGNQKLECHLQSSLGLDYSISQFPGKHVCDSNNQLPNSGPDSVAFPEIELVIEKLNQLSEHEFEVQGKWNVHGVSQPASSLKMKLEINGEEAVSSGEVQFHLKDYGITVKRAFVISAADTATMKWNISFKKSQESEQKP